MKKLLFKFITYIGLFVILPILKLFGKKFYEKNVVPKLINYLCGTKPNRYQRKKITIQLNQLIAVKRKEVLKCDIPLSKRIWCK